MPILDHLKKQGKILAVCLMAVCTQGFMVSFAQAFPGSWNNSCSNKTQYMGQIQGYCGPQKDKKWASMHVAGCKAARYYNKRLSCERR